MPTAPIWLSRARRAPFTSPPPLRSRAVSRWPVSLVWERPCTASIAGGGRSPRQTPRGRPRRALRRRPHEHRLHRPAAATNTARLVVAPAGRGRGSAAAADRLCRATLVAAALSVLPVRAGRGSLPG